MRENSKAKWHCDYAKAQEMSYEETLYMRTPRYHAELFRKRAVEGGVLIIMTFGLDS